MGGVQKEVREGIECERGTPPEAEARGRTRKDHPSLFSQRYGAQQRRSPGCGLEARDEMRASSPLYTFLPIEVDGFESLAELALDMRWSWSHAADEVWKQLDPALWEATYNPWV